MLKSSELKNKVKTKRGHKGQIIAVMLMLKQKRKKHSEVTSGRKVHEASVECVWGQYGCDNMGDGPYTLAQRVFKVAISWM